MREQHRREKEVMRKESERERDMGERVTWEKE